MGGRCKSFRPPIPAPAGGSVRRAIVASDGSALRLPGRRRIRHLTSRAASAAPGEGSPTMTPCPQRTQGTYCEAPALRRHSPRVEFEHVACRQAFRLAGRQIWSATSRRPSSGVVSPQLSQLVGKPPSGPRWLHEIKLDGFRGARLKGITSLGLV
jgi:hypothetical protein